MSMGSSVSGTDSLLKRERKQGLLPIFV